MNKSYAIAEIKNAIKTTNRKFSDGQLGAYVTSDECDTQVAAELFPSLETIFKLYLHEDESVDALVNDNSRLEEEKSVLHRQIEAALSENARQFEKVKELEAEIKNLKTDNLYFVESLDKAQKDCIKYEEKLQVKEDGSLGKIPSELTITHKVEVDEKTLGAYLSSTWIAGMQHGPNESSKLMLQVKKWLGIYSD